MTKEPTEGWASDELTEVNNGLLLLGWRIDARLTSDDARLVRDVAREALEGSARGPLSTELVDVLAAKAFGVMEFQLMNVDERALMASGPYKESSILGRCLALIDEATLCYYCGYYTASLAALFVVLERGLRQLQSRQPGKGDDSFAALRAAVAKLPDSDSRREAEKILSAVYSRYDAQSPTQFFFNRHGLLHGLRGPMDVDRMNCVRTRLLFDVLTSAEGLGREIVLSEEYYRRHATYEACIRSAAEKRLLLRS